MTPNFFRKDRELPILDLLNKIWHYVMAQRSDRYTEATKLVAQQTIFTNYCYEQLQLSHTSALGHTIS